MNDNKEEIIDPILAGEEFTFRKLMISGVENSSVLDSNSPRMAEEETCLFHRDIPGGDDYFRLLHASLEDSMSRRKPFPVVRFADGEYAFYGYSLHCNGLYRQAESVREIKDAMQMHAEAIRSLVRLGKIAPLIFPGNVRKQKRGLLDLLRSRQNPSARDFLDFLSSQGINLDRNNYLPFYVVYAYLASGEFAGSVHGKKICIVNSEFNEGHVREWFKNSKSEPDIRFAAVPDSYVATRWLSMKDEVLADIPEDTDLCLVGAGVGALPVCVDIAVKFSIPAIDAGHVLNMMNGREDKSNGPRLYTIWKERS